MAKEKAQINFQLKPDEAVLVDHFAKEDGFDNRSAWMRKLIRQEITRRNALKDAAALVLASDEAGQKNA